MYVLKKNPIRIKPKLNAEYIQFGKIAIKLIIEKIIYTGYSNILLDGV